MATRFDKVVDRRGTNSYKWDSSLRGDVLPLWVADMDFETAPCVVEALRRRVEHGVFGYVRVPETYYEALTGWFARKHGWKMRPEHVIYTSGVVPAISAIIKAMTEPGDKVLVQTPVYNCFFSSIRNNGCEIVSSQLVNDGNRYTIDFEDFEKKASDERVKVFLLCNPHNPAGRVWTRDELRQMGEICKRHHVFVVSDEIHCEFVFPGHQYVPYASVDPSFLPSAAICTSPSKAFNIAGLQIANITATDDDVRKKIDKAININEVCDVNPFGVEALIAAYNQGESWLEELKAYIYGNYRYAREYIESEMPELRTNEMEGTYLLWIDTKAMRQSSEELESAMLEEVGLWLNSGSMYGDAGEGYMRMNLACPRQTLTEALRRMKRYYDRRLQK